ncbi:hypothetical protein ACTMTJ_04680 [Phytohabitans sp. LJ34]|uniref:hypothetical protein n=1 Tax=Phytohabitans sp. LJ34 TaxID=3452217 RepID=UPI003F8A4873
MRVSVVGRLAIVSLAPALTLVPSGCFATDGTPPTPPPSVASREIREFDFANAEWLDTSVSETEKLQDGAARRSEDTALSPMSGGGSWKLLDGAQFADADGDGDEDAAVGLATSGGQSANVGWYIWLWQGGTAVQLRRAIVSTTRCDRPIDGVTAVAGGFEVRTFVFQSNVDNCAGGGAVPVTFVAGVRDGWPVRIRPEFGPLATCDPKALTVPLRPGGEVQLRVDTDARAPIVEPAQRYDSLMVSELSVSPYLTDEERGDWVLARAVRGDKVTCGYAHVDQVLGPA